MQTSVLSLSDRAGDPEWRITPGLTDYETALAEMEQRVAAIREQGAPDLIWLLEHPPLYTAGTSARDSDLIAPGRFPVYHPGRGGQFTYHGPGQRVVYVMMDLKPRGGDVRQFVCDLEAWMIAVLADFGIAAERRAGRVGVWVARGNGPLAREDKIGAVGVRVRRWVSFHGISLNVNPDLDHFTGIVPCGIREHGVTSLADLGVAASMAEVDASLRRHFDAIFTTPSAP